MDSATKRPSSYPLPSFRDQLAAEVNAMVSHVLSTGLKVPRSILSVLDALDKHPSQVEIAKLLEAHEVLTQVIAPARPSAILALTKRSATAGKFRAITLPIVKWIAALGVVSLVAFIALSMSTEINDPKNGNIFQADGTALLINELFYLSAAGLGTSFTGLSKIEQDLKTGVFDIRYQWVYWTRFMIGIIAGMVLATLLNVSFAPAGASEAIVSQQQFSAAALALIGGFSSSVVHRLLTRMVEALETLLRGSMEEVTTMHEQAFKARLAQQEVQGRIKVAATLAELQRELSRSGDPATIAKQLDELLQSLLHSEASLLPASSANASAQEKEKEPAG